MTLKIEIKEVIEHEDGSATIVFDCDEKVRNALISEGFISIIEKAIKKEEELQINDT